MLMLNNTVVIIGFAILITVESSSIKYFAIFLAAAGGFPTGPIYLTWNPSNAAGPSIRAVTSAYIVGAANLGAILATWTYLPEDAPLYKRGHRLNLSTQAVAFVLAGCGILYAKWENGKRERAERDHRLQGLAEEEKYALGYRHLEFRYLQ